MKDDPDSISSPAQHPPLSIEALLETSKGLWRGCDDASLGTQNGVCTATGFPELDAILPGHGWPASGLMEAIVKQRGIGELQLFLPLMRTLIARGNWVLWIAPPFSPYAPGLAQAGIDLRRVLVVGQKPAPAKTPNTAEDNLGKSEEGRKNEAPNTVSFTETLWSMEKALQTPHCGLVLAWQSYLPQRALRRLQLAAVTGNALGVLFMQNNSEHSPSSIRLEIKDSAEGSGYDTEVNVLKARGSFRPSSARIKLCTRFNEGVIR